MDGRVQEPVIKFMKDYCGARYVDAITEAGPVKMLAEAANGDAGEYAAEVDDILRRLDISVNVHGSELIAVVAHYDCGGNPVGKDVQLGQLDKAVKFLKGKLGKIEIIGLWVDENWVASRNNG